MSGFYAADKPYLAQSADQRRARFPFSSSIARMPMRRPGEELRGGAIASRHTGSEERFSDSSRSDSSGPEGQRSGTRRAPQVQNSSTPFRWPVTHMNCRILCNRKQKNGKLRNRAVLTAEHED